MENTRFKMMENKQASSSLFVRVRGSSLIPLRSVEADILGITIKRNLDEDRSPLWKHVGPLLGNFLLGTPIGMYQTCDSLRASVSQVSKSFEDLFE